jgi:hypothetical protein
MDSKATTKALRAANGARRSSTIGPPCEPPRVRFWHKADIDFHAHMSAFGAKRTSLIGWPMSGHDPMQTSHHSAIETGVFVKASRQRISPARRGS